MILAILQARVSSSRLPSKVLKPILGRPMVALQIERVKRARRIDRLIVATSTDKTDDALAELCRSIGVECHRGSLEDVLDRFYTAAAPHRPDHVVRLTGDCPLADPELIDRIIERHLESGADYTSNTIPPTWPDGLDAEVVRFEALATAWREAKLPSQREHVMPFIHQQPGRFKLCPVRGEKDLSRLRWTVDEAQDFAFVSRVYEELYPKNPAFTTRDVLALLEAHPEVARMNAGFERNEGMNLSVKKDMFSKRYQRSRELLERALKTIPLGAQTFSKSKTQYPEGVSPHFIQRGQGSRVWDVDGNEYVDFVSSLCSITLGYNDPDVNAAVRRQLDEGVIFSLSHPIEMQVAEKLVEMVPCAELVRFGKNGSDATAGAIRVARAHTNRDRVAVCGYHGWQDWYIGSTARNRGVPKATRELTHTFAYNDLDSLHRLFKEHPDQFAAVILEPMNVTAPAKGFLEGVQELTRKHGALLVFDETITGFRFANGGAQELFGVTPDLATFGKGMSNGYPVAAVAGRADVMRLMEEIFFSFTFGGETLSLAASLATMTKLTREPVVRTIHAQGEKVMAGVRDRIARHGVEGFLGLAGSPSWSFLTFRDTPKYTQWQLKTLFFQELFLRGILSFGTHNMSYAHSDADVQKLLGTYDEIFPMLKSAVEGGTLERLLCTKPLEPLFKVR